MNKILESSERFTDKGILLYEFCNEFLVICPRCKEMAKVVPISFESKKLNSLLLAPRKLVCQNCVYRNTWEGNRILVGSNVDWYFRVPLWLEISCCGERLWAYNPKHLETIEQYVSAKLRERNKDGKKSFLSKLPTWIKLAKNRDEILKAIRKLKATIS